MVALCVVQSVLIAGLLVQRRKRARAEKLLADQLRFETVLGQASRTFTDVAAERVEAELRDWLGRIGMESAAHQVAVSLIDESWNVLRPVYSWTHIQPSQEAGPVAIGAAEVACINSGAVVSRPLQREGGERTLLLVPLAVGGRVWGVLLLETRARLPFGEGVPIARLRLLGEVVANALARTRAAEELALRTEALTESHEEYRRLADRLIEAQESERRRIARELHDDITQRLALIGLEAGELGQRDGEAAALPRSALERLAEEVRSLVRDVTGLSHRLHPSLLDRLGIAAAVRTLCRDLSGQSGIDLSFSEGNLPDALPTAQSLAIYRVAQEALRNALKHSGASRVAVLLTVEDGALILEVSDDGHGFDVERSRTGDGLGLLSMTERVEVLGGTLIVHSEPGVGTRLRVRMPLGKTESSATAVGQVAGSSP